MALDQEEEDWTTLEYARHYELTKKYDADCVSSGDLPIPSDDPTDWDFGFPSAENVADRLSVLTKERLAVSRDAAVLLRAMHELRIAPENEDAVDDHYQWVRRLKQELPILKTDNELDMLSFGNRAMPALKEIMIPSEVVDEEKDEGFEWPAKYLAYPTQCDKQIKAEKLAVSREVLLCLQDALADHFNAEDAEKLVDGSLQRKKVGHFSCFEDDADGLEHCASAFDSTSSPHVSTNDSIYTIFAS